MEHKGGEHLETVKSAINALEVSPSKSQGSSPVYGARKDAAGAHMKKSNGGAADCESEFMHGDGHIPKRR